MEQVLQIVVLCVGMAVFLFGMKFMTMQMSALGESRLKKRLKSCGTFEGLLLGAVVTALVHSSSAVTSMTVSAVESGVLTSSGAAAVVAGANVGTTATAFLISLCELKTSFTGIIVYAASALSAILFFTVQRKGLKKFFGIVLGTCVLFMGLQIMSDAADTLAKTDFVRSTIKFLDNPFAGLAGGTVITAVLQSSSATVGLLQAMSASENLTIYKCVAVIIGENIGTCATALIASAGTGAMARCVAKENLYLNVAGGIVFFALVYFVCAPLCPQLVQSKSTPFTIAIIHFLFNVFSTAVYIPFIVKRPQRLCRMP